GSEPIPGGDKVEYAGTLEVGEHFGEVRTGAVAHYHGARERRIPQDVAQRLRLYQILPVDPQRIAVDDGRALGQWQPREVFTELFGHTQVHLVVHQPQCDLGDLRGELLDLDAVELVDIDGDVV